MSQQESNEKLMINDTNTKEYCHGTFLIIYWKQPFGHRNSGIFYNANKKRITHPVSYFGIRVWTTLSS